MKKIFIVLMLGLLMVSCGGSNGTSSSSSGSSGGYYRTEKTDELKTLLGDRYLGIKEIDYEKYMNDSEIKGIEGLKAWSNEDNWLITKDTEIASKERKICILALSENFSLDGIIQVANQNDMVFLNVSLESYLNIRDSLRERIYEYPYIFQIVPKEYVK